MIWRLSVLVLFVSTAFAQRTNPYRPFPAPEDYCRDNPKMPTCIKGKPIDMNAINGTLYKMPPNGTPGAQPPVTPRRTATSPSSVDLTSIAPVALQDWRFSHSSPALLVSVNIGSLLKSPVWNKILPQNARSALSEIGQVLISVDSNGAGSPQVLMLAKGSIDGALGMWLRSGSDTEARRLDAMTLLIGDPRSLEFANLRLRSPVGHQTSNLLQQTATREAMKYDLWVGIDPRHLPSMAAAFGARSNPTLNALSNLRGISLGVYLRDQIRVEALMDAPSVEIAGRMLAAYQAQQQNSKGQVWTTLEGTKVRYIEIEELSQLADSPLFDADTARIIQPQLDRLMQSLAGLGAQSAPSPAARPSSGGAIVIQGLAGGPKQLPAK